MQCRAAVIRASSLTGGGRARSLMLWSWLASWQSMSWTHWVKSRQVLTWYHITWAQIHHPHICNWKSRLHAQLIGGAQRQRPLPSIYSLRSGRTARGVAQGQLSRTNAPLITKTLHTKNPECRVLGTNSAPPAQKPFAIPPAQCHSPQRSHHIVKQ